MKQSSFAALQFSALRIFLFGLLVSTLGSTMQVVAVGWHVYELTHSPISLGFIGLAGFIPILISFLPGGAIADSFNRKKILIVLQIFFGLGACILGFATVLHSISPWLIYGVLGLNGLLITVDLPARSAIIPLLVPQEYAFGAVSLNTLCRQTASVLGPAIAGFLIAFYGPQSVYFFNAVSFLVMLIALCLIHVPNLLEKKTTVSLSAIGEGIMFIRHSPLISSTMLLDFFVTFLASCVVLLPVFAKDVLHADARQLGLLYAAPAVGGVLAGFIFSSLGNIKHQGKIIFLAIGVYGLATIGFGLSHSFFLSLLFLACAGAGDMVSTIIRNGIRQLMTPDSMRGRMTAISMVFFIGGPFLGDTEAGFLAGLIGAPLSVVVGGVAAVLFVSGIWAKIPKLRKYHNSEIST